MPAGILRQLTLHTDKPQPAELRDFETRHPGIVELNVAGPCLRDKKWFVGCPVLRQLETLPVVPDIHPDHVSESFESWEGSVELSSFALYDVYLRQIEVLLS